MFRIDYSEEIKESEDQVRRLEEVRYAKFQYLKKVNSFCFDEDLGFAKLDAYTYEERVALRKERKKALDSHREALDALISAKKNLEMNKRRHVAK